MLQIKRTTSLVLISLALISYTHCSDSDPGWLDEKCEILDESGDDTCDTAKHLNCVNGKCQCRDPANQIFTYREEVHRFKGDWAPLHLVGLLTTTPPPPLPRYRRVYSCYTLVGSQCALGYSTQPVELRDTTTATAIRTNDSATEMTTAASDGPPLVSSDPFAREFVAIPGCVQNAVCKATILQTDDYPILVPYCECEPGFKRIRAELCAKESELGNPTGAIPIT